MIRETLHHNELFSLLNDTNIEKLLKKFEYFSKKEKDVILARGKPIDALYLSFESSLCYISKEGEEIYPKNTLFGDRFISSDENPIKSSGSLVMAKNGDIATILFKEIESILGRSLNTIPFIRPEIIRKVEKAKGKLQVDRQQVERDWTINEVEIIFKIGDGICGFIYIGRNIVRNEVYALKVVSYEQIRKMDFSNYLLNEKEVLSKLENRFFLP